MFYRLLYSGAALLICSSSFADSSEIAQSSQRPKSNQQQCEKKKGPPLFEQGMELPDNKYPAAYNAPACIRLRNSWDFDVFASFIYWHVSQEYMDIAHVTPSPTASALTTVNGTVVFQNFKYKPGFKVGFGFQTDHDDWAFRAEYTWLHQRVTTPSTTPPALPSGVADEWVTQDWFSPFISGADAAAVSSSWRLNFDMVDAVMERPFYQGTMLTVTPYGGMRAAWIRQKFRNNTFDIAGVQTASVLNRSSCWSLGPTTGVGAHWLLGCGFRFQGNAGASILYTRYTRITQSQVNPVPDLGTTSTTRNYNVLRPVGQLAVGLGWGSYCCDNDFYFDIGLDYEFLYFWDQNVMRGWVGMLRGYANDLGALQLHGLTATFRFDF